MDELSPTNASAAALPAFTALGQQWSSAPPTTAATTAATPLPASTSPGDGAPADDTSAWLVSIHAGDDLASAARRAGAGLALTLPFALAAGLRTNAAPLDALVAGLALPVGLAMIALSGVSASTLGISLVAAPLSPATAASIASRGVFRAGLLLVGLAPLTALGVASGRALEALLSSSLVVFVAGATGIGTIARGLVAATLAQDGSARLGSAVVALLFAMFALVMGLRVWLPVADALSAPIFGGAP